MNRFCLLSISICVLFYTLSGIFNNTQAQTTDIGIIGGINISTHLNNFMYSEDDILLEFDPKSTVGYQAGLAIRQKLTRALRFQAEPSLIMLGAKYDEPFTLRGYELQTESRTELLYLQLPLMLQLTTTPPRQVVYGRQEARTTYHLTSGVFGGYLLDARFAGTNTGAPLGISFEGDFSNDVKSQYSEYDAGVIFGLGFEHGLYQKIGFETRALYSVIDSGNDSDLMDFKPQNLALTFAIYFLF